MYTFSTKNVVLIFQYQCKGSLLVVALMQGTWVGCGHVRVYLRKKKNLWKRPWKAPTSSHNSKIGKNGSATWISMCRVRVDSYRAIVKSMVWYVWCSVQCNTYMLYMVSCNYVLETNISISVLLFFCILEKNSVSS